MAENITNVHLMNVPFENDYKHTLYFNSQTEQRNYFENLNSKSFSDFSYQRKEGVMRIPIQYDVAIKYNYVMYQNTEYSNKWFYAFITNYEFKGDDQTNITLETDVIQTWMFDYTIKPSFIDREHCDDDTIGLHTLNENLECGEYVSTYNYDVEELTKIRIVIGVTEVFLDNFGGWKGQVLGGIYHGTISGITYYSFPYSAKGLTMLSKALEFYDKETKGDAIQNMFLAPEILCKSILTDEGINKLTDLLMSGFYVIQYNENYKQDISLNRNISSNNQSYTPKNNKLNCYPYKYLLLSNNNGGSAIYQFENFSSENDFEFELKGTLTPGCSIRIVPKNYKQRELFEEEGLNAGKYPICNWASDVYTNWITQNGVNIGLNLVSGVGQIVAGIGIAVGSGGIGTAVGGASVVGGISTITNQLSQIHQMSFTPPQSKGNVNNGDIITTSNKNTFSFYTMTIKEEYIKIIDNYFSMYGYKTNRVKTPNSNHRKNYWYIKTIDVNLSGNVPLIDIQKIKNCYDNGITFWKNANNIKDYSVDNAII